MELAEFIKGTLLSITAGITQANSDRGEPYPFTLVGSDDGVIDFEVYVLVESESNKKGKIEAGANIISSLKVALSGEGSKSQKDSSKNLIKFKVKPAERSIF